MLEEYDFSGWATRTNLKCGDGRIIMKDAFKGCDGTTVPLVWNHQHSDPLNVLGHAYLENRDDGVYAYCKFNDTESGQAAKNLVGHGDVTALSIYANKLKQNGPNVEHGIIREVSLVLAGANPGAFIDSVMCHGDNGEDEEAIIQFITGDDIAMNEKKESMEHSQSLEEVLDSLTDEQYAALVDHFAHAEEGEKDETVEDVFNTLTEKQKKVVYYIIGQAVEDAKGAVENNEGDESMKHNVFENEGAEQNALSHSEIQAIFADAKKCGSLKEAVLAHGESDADYTPATGPNGTAGTDYGIQYVNYLFPEDKNVNNVPGFIKRETDWVGDFMGNVHHTPFSRVKSQFANITADAARAKGYVKGKMKTEEVITLLKRSTGPQTIYKKQRMDRDDMLDITDFDVVAWLKAEMRLMLDEEIARACLVGDGRSPASDDKINENNVRPIWTDADLYTIKYKIDGSGLTTDALKAKAFIRACVKSRKDYKGKGNPILFTTEDMLTDCLLLEDLNGRVIYDTVEKLQTALRVRKIVTVPVMENLTRVDGSNTNTLMGIIVNPQDYNIGADKGGSVAMFEDFDIDYNQQKYLIETRCSGALITPYSAIAIESYVETPVDDGEEGGGE